MYKDLQRFSHRQIYSCNEVGRQPGFASFVGHERVLKVSRNGQVQFVDSSGVHDNMINVITRSWALEVFLNFFKNKK